MQNPPCPSLSKPERIILAPAHARSLHSETNLFLPPTGGACVDLAGYLEGPPSPLPFPWRSGTSSLGFFQMNVPLALVRNMRQQGLKLSNCIFFLKLTDLVDDWCWSRSYWKLEASGVQSTAAFLRTLELLILFRFLALHPFPWLFVG